MPKKSEPNTSKRPVGSKPRSKTNAISLKRVSELAGVTQSTASRILNDHPDYNYAPATVKRVFEVAREHGYRTNQLYRSVFTGKTMSAGVITSAGGYYAAITKGIHDRLLEDGFAVVMGINEADFDDPASSVEKRIIERLNRHRVDGFILRPTLDSATDEHFRDIIDMHVPLITVDREVPAPYADFIGSDNVAGGRLAAVHLAELGHTDMVQFAGPQQVGVFRDRAQGFEAEMLERGHAIQTVLCADDDDVIAKAELFFARENRPTAVFCATDVYAGRIYEVLSRLGLCVPRDISVVGFGDVESVQFLEPRLTTIDQHPYDVGVEAARLFLERMAEPEGQRHERQCIYLPVDLIVRGSTAKPRA